MKKLELIREAKLFRLIPGRTRKSRLEASGMAYDVPFEVHFTGPVERVSFRPDPPEARAGSDRAAGR